MKTHKYVSLQGPADQSYMDSALGRLYDVVKDIINLDFLILEDDFWADNNLLLKVENKVRCKLGGKHDIEEQ